MRMQWWCLCLETSSAWVQCLKWREGEPQWFSSTILASLQSSNQRYCSSHSTHRCSWSKCPLWYRSRMGGTRGALVILRRKCSLMLCPLDQWHHVQSPTFRIRLLTPHQLLYHLSVSQVVIPDEAHCCCIARKLHSVVGGHVSVISMNSKVLRVVFSRCAGFSKEKRRWCPRWSSLVTRHTGMNITSCARVCAECRKVPPSFLTTGRR